MEVLEITGSSKRSTFHYFLTALLVLHPQELQSRITGKLWLFDSLTPVIFHGENSWAGLNPQHGKSSLKPKETDVVEILNGPMGLVHIL